MTSEEVDRDFEQLTQVHGATQNVWNLYRMKRLFKKPLNDDDKLFRSNLLFQQHYTFSTIIL